MRTHGTLFPLVLAALVSFTFMAGCDDERDVASEDAEIPTLRPDTGNRQIGDPQADAGPDEADAGAPDPDAAAFDPDAGPDDIDSGLDPDTGAPECSDEISCNGEYLCVEGECVYAGPDPLACVQIDLPEGQYGRVIGTGRLEFDDYEVDLNLRPMCRIFGVSVNEDGPFRRMMACWGRRPSVNHAEFVLYDILSAPRGDMTWTSEMDEVYQSGWRIDLATEGETTIEIDAAITDENPGGELAFWVGSSWEHLVMLDEEQRPFGGTATTLAKLSGYICWDFDDPEDQPGQ